MQKAVLQKVRYSIKLTADAEHLKGPAALIGNGLSGTANVPIKMIVRISAIGGTVLLVLSALI